MKSYSFEEEKAHSNVPFWMIIMVTIIQFLNFESVNPYQLSVFSSSNSTDLLEFEDNRGTDLFEDLDFEDFEDVPLSASVYGSNTISIEKDQHSDIVTSDKVTETVQSNSGVENSDKQMEDQVPVFDRSFNYVGKLKEYSEQKQIKALAYVDVHSTEGFISTVSFTISDSGELVELCGERQKKKKEARKLAAFKACYKLNLVS